MKGQREFYIVRGNGCVLNKNGWKWDDGPENAKKYKRLNDAIWRAERIKDCYHERVTIMDTNGNEVYRTNEA